MQKYFYFRDSADEADDDGMGSSITVPVDSISGIVPVAITTLDIHLRKNGLVTDQKVTLTVTRGKLQEVMHEIVAHINGYSHNKSPLTVMADAATIDVDDTTKSEIFFSNDVTAIAFGAAGY